MEIRVDKESMVPKYFVSFHKIYYVYCKSKEVLQEFLRKYNIASSKVEYNTRFSVWCAGVYDPKHKVFIEQNLECE